VEVDQRLYHEYNVRVMPFLFVLDPAGTVRNTGLANDRETLSNMWRVARARRKGLGETPCTPQSVNRRRVGRGMTIAIYIGRAALAVTLLAAGVAKVGARDHFTQMLGGLGVAPRWRYPATWMLIVVEVGLGLASALGLFVRGVDVSVLLLMLLMLAMAAVALRRTPGMPCRCFGTLVDSTFRPRMVLRNALLVVVAGAVLLGDAAVAPDYYTSTLPTLVALSGMIVFCVAVLEAVKAIGIVERDRNVSVS